MITPGKVTPAVEETIKKSAVEQMGRLLTQLRGSYWISSGFFTLLTKLTTVAFGFANFYILIRMLSLEDYGAWVLFISVSTIMELIKHGFIRNPLIRYLSITPAEGQPALQTASVFLNVVLALLQGIVLVIMAFSLSVFWDVPQLQTLFLIYIFTTFTFVPANHFDTVQQAGLQFKALFFTNIVKQGGVFVFVMVAYMTNATVSLQGLAIAQAAGILGSCIMSYFFSRELLRFSRRVEWKWVSELFHYGKFTFGTNVSSMIVKNMNTWMLGRMVSVESVTLFNPAIRISNLVEVPNDTLSTIYFPRVSKDFAAEGSSAVKRRYEKAVGSILAVMAPVILLIMVFASPILRFIAGPGFEATVPILHVTMLYGLLIPFNRFFGVTLDAIGKANVNFKVVLLTALLNFITSLVFIKYYGMIGAAYATLLTYGLMVIANQVYLSRVYNISIISIAGYVLGFYKDGFIRLKRGITAII